MMDRSNGYERIAVEFLAGRGSAHSTGIGVKTVRHWARTLPRGATVIDLGSGSGFPITEVLVTEGLNVYAIDASPSLVQAFHNLPNTPVVCEAVEDSTFFDRTFDGVVAWGLVFLLPPEEQRRLLQRVTAILVPGGKSSLVQRGLLYRFPPPLLPRHGAPEDSSVTLGQAGPIA